jgi:hypothetical protein
VGENQFQYVTCRCQNCNGGIEFDASGYSKGETRSAECPHCKMETLLFIPQPTPIVNSSTKSSNSQKTYSNQTAVVLWTITLFFLLLVVLTLVFASSSNWILISFGFLVPIALVSVHYQSRNSQGKQPKQPKPKYICSNCGSLSLTGLFCLGCDTGSFIRLETPRGQELLATYHGKVTAKERIEIGDEATRKLLRSLEPIPVSGSIAIELEKLAALVRTGAITTDEWQRAKNLYLGQPEGKKREHALARIRELFDLQQSGAVSESEFNAVKWDILSRGVV